MTVNPHKFRKSEFGTHEVHGTIYDKYVSVGFDELGYPSTDELTDYNYFYGLGRYNEFENNAAIFWQPNVAYYMREEIYAKYKSMADARTALGYPVSDETTGPNGGRYNWFEYGQILWHPNNPLPPPPAPQLRAYEVHGEIFTQYNNRNGVYGYLGYPTTDPTVEDPDGNPDCKSSAFQGGWIYWTSSLGVEDTSHKAYGGRYYTCKNIPDWHDLRARTAVDPWLVKYRKNVVENAFIENSLGLDDHGLCMPAAGDRYCTGGGLECVGGWCSEFAHYVLLMNQGGIYNIGTPYTDLGDCYLVQHFLTVFMYNTTHPGLWSDHRAIQAWSIEPGDYLSTQYGDHSTIVVGVRWDYARLWTVERYHEPDPNDCVKFNGYDFVYPDGTINPEFFGVGHLHCDIVAYQANCSY